MKVSLYDENIIMGSCRLSIFDLSSRGNMPMKDKSGRYFIIYNGEIYNFQELKEKYKISTFSNSDTEVLLELFVKGKKFLMKLMEFMRSSFLIKIKVKFTVLDID